MLIQTEPTAVITLFFLFAVSIRLRQLRQSSVGAGGNPGHERLPDRHEAAEGAAEALKERQQTVLILALRLFLLTMLALLG